MWDYIRSVGGSVYHGADAEALSIDVYNKSDGTSLYTITTPRYRIEAPTLALAIPGIYYANLTGNVPEAIRQTKQVLDTFRKRFIPLSLISHF